MGKTKDPVTEARIQMHDKTKHCVLMAPSEDVV